MILTKYHLVYKASCISNVRLNFPSNIWFNIVSYVIAQNGINWTIMYQVATELPALALQFILSKYEISKFYLISADND